LEDLRSVRVALSEIVQALASGQLDRHSVGLMLYAIQQATSVSLRASFSWKPRWKRRRKI
jgi:hypothetical protein